MNLLLLAGTREADQIADAVCDIRGVSLTFSGRRVPSALPAQAETETRAFLDQNDYRNWLEQRGFDTVLDATHPFAPEMGHMTADLADGLGIAYARVLRPPWHPSARDRWTDLQSSADAPAHIPPDATVFVATGLDDLPALTDLDPRNVLVRVKHPPTRPFPFAKGRFLSAPGPFTVEGECDLFRREGVDWILSRNSGGQGSWPKIEAARNLGLPVAMVHRPAQPPGVSLPTVEAALDWVRARISGG